MIPIPRIVSSIAPFFVYHTLVGIRYGCPLLLSREEKQISLKDSCVFCSMGRWRIRIGLATGDSHYTGTTSPQVQIFGIPPFVEPGYGDGMITYEYFRECGWPMSVWQPITLMAFMTQSIDLRPVFKTILYDSNQQGRTLPSTLYLRGLPQCPKDNTGRHNEKFGECGKHPREAAMRQDFEVAFLTIWWLIHLNHYFSTPFLLWSCVQ